MSNCGRINSLSSYKLITFNVSLAVVTTMWTHVTICETVAEVNESAINK